MSILKMLLYADDIDLICDKIGHVQKLLNLHRDYCNKWGLKVNMLKIILKMLVFGNGGSVKKMKGYFDGTEIEIVKYCKCLGVLFSSRLSWSPAQALLAAQGSKAMFSIDTLNYTYDFPYVNILVNVFYLFLHRLAKSGELKLTIRLKMCS